jgi:hypothetical protein
MKLIIDIPDYDYKQIKEYYEKNDTVEATYSYIYHGTPLPKGHGRLIDADVLNRKDVNCANVPMNFIDTAPTIIEADKAESEES